MSDLNSLMQEMKSGFRRMEQLQQNVTRDKRRNMDRYFSRVINQKKQRYFSDLILL